MSTDFDAIVVGLGAMGSCALEALARRGARVLGIDRHDPPHAFGSSHGGSRVIRLSYFEHADYVPLLREAYEGFDRLSRDGGEPLRFENGLVVAGAPGSEVTAGMRRSAEIHGLAIDAIDGRELVRRFPQFSVPTAWEAVYESRGGFVRPESTIRTALSLAVRRGAEILRSTPVVAWGARDGRAWVDTPRGRLEGRALVLAGGAWMPQLLADETERTPSSRLVPTRETIVWIDDAADPSWSHDRMPVWLFDRGVHAAAYGIPTFTSMGAPRGLKVALHGAGPPTDPDAPERPVDDRAVRETVEAVREFLPAAQGRSVVAAKHCLYTMSDDGDFLVGLSRSRPEVVLAAGFSGHGFKFAPVMGEVLADLALTRTTRRPIGFLSPSRTIPPEGGR
ncbi:MAG: hypothetical protein RL136_1025 [Planctomycetota bacterium]|jgi:sarcosine oxidase